MATPDSDTTPATSPAIAPWEIRRQTRGKNVLKRALPWLGGLLLVALVAWGLWPKPVVVETGIAVRAALTVRVSEEGKTRVRNRYVIAAPVAGIMRRVTLKPGDAVVAGETVITTIEPVVSPLVEPRARAQAEAIVAMREASRKQAEQSLEVANAASRLAGAELDRVRSVTRGGSLSQSERERVEMEASMKSAEMRATEFSLQVIDYELAQARAALQRPAADSTDNLVEVRSPVSGRVLRVMQESEMVAGPGLEILEVGDPEDLEIEAEILSRDAVTIRPGDSVEIEQWGGEKPLAGRVRRVEPAAFTKISALGVEEQRVIVLSDLVDVPDAAKTLGDRFRVEVRVAIWHSDDVLVVPAGALFRQGNAWMTFVFEDGKAVLTAVEAGHSDGRFTEILSGIEAGTEVLLHPPDTVEDGSAVVRRGN
jgi:HlyD family secretion protein